MLKVLLILMGLTVAWLYFGHLWRIGALGITLFAVAAAAALVFVLGGF